MIKGRAYSHKPNKSKEDFMDYTKKTICIAISDKISNEHVTNKTVTWSELMTLLSKPSLRSKKDGPYFVGASCKNEHRNGENIEHRQLLTLDVDKNMPVDWDDDIDMLLGYEAYAYTTFNSTSDMPRIRLVLPLSRPLTKVIEYKQLVSHVMKQLNQWGFDKGASFDYARAMYMPACPSKNEDQFKTFHNKNKWIDVDSVLAIQEDVSQDAPTWASSKSDPRLNANEVGFFCRAVGDIHNAIDMFLSDKYQWINGNLYHCIGSNSKPGVRIYDDAQFLYSHHAKKDPAATGHCLSAFDVVRVHLFGTLDTDTSLDVHELPSYDAMIKDSRICGLITQQRELEFGNSIDDFDDIDDELAVPDIKKVQEVPKQINDDDWIHNPPGILKEMISEIMAAAHRPVYEYALAAAIQALSLACMNHYLGFDGVKLNLMTINVGDTGSGKDNGRQFVKSVANVLGLEYQDRLKSYQSLIKNLVYDGYACLPIDECQQYFNKSGSNQAYLADLGDVMMNLFTETVYKIDLDDARLFVEKFEKQIMSLESQINPTDGPMPSELQVNYYRNKINIIKSQLKRVVDGIKYPQLCFFGTTTPQRFDKFFTEDALDSGLFPRFMWGIPDAVGIVPLVAKTSCMGEFSDAINVRLKMIGSSLNKSRFVPMNISREARDAFNDIRLWIDSDSKRNSEYGAVWRRGLEMIQRISCIVACCDKEVTVDHIQWAKKYVLERSIKPFITKMDERYLAKEVSQKQKDGQNDKIAKNRIKHCLRNGKLTSGKLWQAYSRNKAYKDKEFYFATIGKLIDSGCVTKLKIAGKNNKTTFEFELT